MVYFIVGAAAGLVMTVVFSAAAPVMVFSLARDAGHWSSARISRANPMTLMLGLVVLAYPLWTLIGGMLGLVYGLVLQAADGAGLAYSAAVTSIALLGAIPCAALLRGAAVGVVILAASFAGVYGWLLPMLVAAAER